MSRARPPKLEPRAGEARPAPPPTVEELVERARIAGAAGSGPGPTEFRRTVERIVAGDRRALGQLEPPVRLGVAAAWAAVANTYGATAELPVIDPVRTVAALHVARARVVEEAERGGRVAIATSVPGCLLTLHLAFAGLVTARAGEVVDVADIGPIRADGRTPRWLRWIGGVAVVTDGHALCASQDGEAAREWIFAIPRPTLVVADGAFAEVAFEQGIDVVTLSGLDRPGIAIVGAAAGRAVVVPMRTDRPARAYRILEEIVTGFPLDQGLCEPGATPETPGPPAGV
jgi:hypothetical protein